MALVYTKEKAPQARTWGTVALSTNADGITGADIIDCGGLSLAAIELSTVCTDANYSLKVGIDSTAVMQTLLGTTGNTVTFGSTGAGVTTGKTIGFDPAPFAGFRFLQVMSGVPGTAIANASGATARLYFAPAYAWK